MRTAKVVRYTAFSLMMLFCTLGGLFAAGYAFDDPGGLAAVGLTLGWLVPVAGLSALALLRPDWGGPVLIGVTALAIAFSWADTVFQLIPTDSWGPVGSMSLLGLGVALGFLGLHRSKLAGWLLVIASAAQMLGIVIGSLRMGDGDGPGPGAMLGGSSGVVVLPLLVIGVLFVIAGSISHEHLLRAAQPAPTH